MLYFIADIITEVPIVGGMASRCRDYLLEGTKDPAQIIIDDTKYRYDRWPTLSKENAAYMESARQFYFQLLDFNGFMLHASATEIDGETYLFAGQSGIGKSTHAQLILNRFQNAKLINDDKPALRYIDGKWFAFGTPWSGKNGININARYPVKAICLLTKKRDRNAIRIADSLSAVTSLISCSAGRSSRKDLEKLAPLLSKLIQDIPIYEMDSLADRAAAELAFQTMKYGMIHED